MQDINLFGEEFVAPLKKTKVDVLLEKISNPEEDIETKDIKNLMKNKKVEIKDKLSILYKYVFRVLGRHSNNTLIITTKADLIKYIYTAIQDGTISYDTETNNSVDPITGEIIGLCLYSKSQKPAYVPIGHIDVNTGKKLKNQVTLEDCTEQLQRLVDNNVNIVMHNGKFDYQFTKMFLHVELPIYWDTMIASRMINENDISASLKWQYHTYVDNTHPIYDIDSMFPGIPYNIIDPFYFALYSATDALMTLELYEYQLNILSQPDQKGAYRLFRDVESPLIIPVAEMELDGIKFDKEYGDRLLDKYTRKFKEAEEDVNLEMEQYTQQINEWKLSKEANAKPKVYKDEKENLLDKKGKPRYTLKDDKGYYKLGKSKLEILEDPINLDSPPQLAILLYDILKLEPVDDENPRSTDKYTLTEYADSGFKLAKKLLERKQIKTLLDDFIEKLPKLVNPVTGKIHCNFNQTGREEKGVVTGRFSSSNPNLQQIPSKNNELRLLFCGDKVEHNVEITEWFYNITDGDEVQLKDGSWVEIGQLQLGMTLENGHIVTKILDRVNFVNGTPYYKIETDVMEGTIKTRTPYMLVGSDYSAQEPRLTAYYSQDETMKQAYIDKKDLYSVIAAQSFGVSYDDCLEFYPKGTVINIDGQEVVCGDKTHQNKAGKKRRKMAKSILLGILYGRGARSVGEQIEKSKEEAQEIIDTFFNSFPKVKKWIDDTHAKVKKLLYVEDWYGRRRHLKDVGLEPYSIEWTEFHKKHNSDFNPILICKDRNNDKIINYYKNELAKAKGWKQIEEIKERALKDELVITSNSNRIAKAERQSVNSIVQGGAATLTKMAMLNIYNDKELNELGLRMLIPIHDEILCTCPKINAEKAADRLVQVMIDTAKPYIDVPMSCDPYIVSHWYWDELSVQIQNELEHLEEGDEEKGIPKLSRDAALQKIKEEHTELLEEDLLKMLENK